MSVGEREPAVSSDRVQLVALLAFLLGGSIVLGLLAVPRAWSSPGWDGVAAVAAMVQAVSVVVGLVYAWRQLNQGRHLALQARRHQLIDRLDNVTFGEVDPIIESVSADLRSLRFLSRWYADLGQIDDEGERRREQFSLKGVYAQHLKELRTTSGSAGPAFRRLERALDVLDVEDVKVHLFHASLLLIKIHDDIEQCDDTEIDETLNRIRMAWGLITTEVKSLVRER